MVLPLYSSGNDRFLVEIDPISQRVRFPENGDWLAFFPAVVGDERGNPLAAT
jgi:hypothetical protein